MSRTESFPTTTTTTASSLHHRKSVVLRKLDSELELLHTDQQRKTAKQRWSACLAFIFKRSKLKSESPPSHILSTCSSSSSSLTTSETATLPSEQLHSNDQADIGNAISEKATYHYSVSLPPTPVSSLSPPPRHIMTRQNRTKSLTPMDQPYPTKTLSSTSSPAPPSFSSTPILPISSSTVISSSPPPPPPPSSTKKASTSVQQRRRCIRRSSVLRLSLDVDQRYSYPSSLGASSDGTHDDHGDIDDEDDGTQYPQDMTFLNNSSTMTRQRCGYWKEETSATATPFMLQDDDDDDNGADDDGDDDESCSSQQIKKQKAHYEAVVTSMYHHHRPSHEDQESIIDRPLSPPPSSSTRTKMDPFLDHPPSCAPLLKTSTPSFPPLPSSPHSLASLDTSSS